MKDPIQSYFIRSDGDVLQIVASTKDKEALNALGFGCTAEEAGEAGSNKDSGLATYADHELAVRKITSVDDVASYLMAAKGKKLDKRGSLETIKAKALEALKDDDSGAST